MIETHSDTTQTYASLRPSFRLSPFAFSLLLCVALCFATASAFAAEEAGDDNFSFESSSLAIPSEDSVEVNLISEENSIQPGRPFWVGIRLHVKDHWHTYWKNPGDVGMPIQVEWNLPGGFQAGAIEWPYPKRFVQDEIVGFGYEGDVMLITRLTPPADLKPGQPAALEADLRWLVCSDAACVPGNGHVSLEIPVKAESPTPNQSTIADFAKARAVLPKKPWNLHARRKNHLVEVHMQASPKAHGPYRYAYFCPENKKMIDSKVEAVLSSVTSKPGQYVLALKDHDDAQADTLKGVLVLQSDSHPHYFYEALEIDIPIAQHDDDDHIASLPASHTEAKVDVLPKGAESDPVHSQLETDAPMEFEGGIGLALVFAFIGGLLLNLMPCVLPVVSFKVLSFVKMAGQSRTTTLKHGLAFSAGVIISFWLFAGLMLVLQAYGRSVGWGFQLQEPLFVAFLAALLLVFGLSMFGVLEIGTSMTALAGQAQSSARSRATELAGSFFGGVLATAVATPCTGPFLGSAIGFAVTLPAVQALLIFTFLGLGMALPYIILAAFPSLLRFLPKPGPWMVTFKELMGFLMFATVLWLVWVFSAQTNSFATFLLLASFLLLAIGAWIYGRWCTPVQKRSTRVTGSIFAIACWAMAAYTIFAAASPAIAAADEIAMNTEAKLSGKHELWENYSPERVAELQKQGIPVLIDFTAKWCLICQANHLVFSTSEVSERIDQLGVVRMKADWTRSDPAITAALRKFGRNGVPLYLLYGRDPAKPPQIMPQVLTPEIVIDYLNGIDKA